MKDNIIQFPDIHKDESKYDNNHYDCLIRRSMERDESFYKEINAIEEKVKRKMKLGGVKLLNNMKQT